MGFCVLTGAALVGESEGWGIAANVACNSSYGLVWYFMGRVPGLMADVKSPVPIWNPTVLKFLGCELGLIVPILALTFSSNRESATSFRKDLPCDTSAC